MGDRRPGDRRHPGRAPIGHPAGLTVYGPGSQPPRHLLGDVAVFDAHLHGDLVYASVDNGGQQPGYVVVSLVEGRVLRASNDLLPTLLLDDHDSPC